MKREEAARFFDWKAEGELKSKRYPEAASLFRRAIFEGSMYPAPHYGLARSLASLRASGKLKGGDAELFDELAIYLGLKALDPEEGKQAVDRLGKERDFEGLRKLTPYKDLLAAAPFARPFWESLVEGDWSNARDILGLKPDGVLSLGGLAPGSQVTGTWRVDQGGRLEVSGLGQGYRSDGRVVSIDWVSLDPSHFSILLGTEAQGGPLTLFRKVSSPLHEAIETDKVALVRLFLGKPGISPPTRLPSLPLPGTSASASSPMRAIISMSGGRTPGIWSYGGRTRRSIDPEPASDPSSRFCATTSRTGASSSSPAS